MSARCFDCRGDGRLTMLADRRVGDRLVGEIRTVVCGLCQGSGEIDDIRFARWTRGRALAARRIAAQLTLLDLARAAHVSPALVSRIERGDCREDDFPAYESALAGLEATAFGRHIPSAAAAAADPAAGEEIPTVSDPAAGEETRA